MAHLRFQTMFPEKFQIDGWIRGDDLLHRRLRANDSPTKKVWRLKKVTKKRLHKWLTVMAIYQL